MHFLCRMADSAYTRSTVSHQALRSTLSKTRKSTRHFGNKLRDAKLDEDLSNIPCKKSAKSLLEENSALIEECRRLLSHLQKGDSLIPSTKCCIDSESKYHEVCELHNVCICMLMRYII